MQSQAIVVVHSNARNPLITLQRTVGNSAVSGMLAGRRAGIEVRVGRMPMTVQRAPSPNAPVDTKARLSSLETRVRRLENQQRASTHLNGFQNQVLGRATAWERAIINVGSAYATAARNHVDAVEAKKKFDAIKSQIMFSVLTIATSGAASWISSAAQTGKAGGILANVLEDTIQASAGEVLSAVGPGVEQRVPSATQIAVSSDPLLFQNQRLVRLKSDEEKAFRFFRQCNESLLKAPPESWDSYDETKQLAAYSKWLAEAGLLAADDKIPSVEEMAAELERGFWARWASSSLLEGVRVPMEGGGTQVLFRSYNSPGYAVEDRFDKLGITKASGVGDFGIWTFDSEIKKVILWADSYVPKAFVT